jgi:stage III sporulation protein AH
MIIGRRQIILAALVVALGAAIFLNWRFSQTGIDVASLAKKTSNLGDTSYVSNQNLSTKAQDYFSQARLSRTQARDAAKQTFATVSDNKNATAQQKQDAEAGIKQLAANIQSETTIENLVKAKGFADCVCFINSDQVNVVVPVKTSTNLTASQAAQVKDIAMSQSKLTNIKIIQVN